LAVSISYFFFSWKNLQSWGAVKVPGRASMKIPSRKGYSMARQCPNSTLEICGSQVCLKDLQSSHKIAILKIPPILRIYAVLPGFPVLPLGRDALPAAAVQVFRGELGAGDELAPGNTVTFLGLARKLGLAYAAGLHGSDLQAAVAVFQNPDLA
jgi:hypothetical protein